MRLFLRLTILLWLTAAYAWAGVATDATAFKDSSAAVTSITTTAFSTTSANELLLAFISSDASTAGVQVSSVTGAGLTWVLVGRANAQLGTAEIWRTFAPSTLANVTVTANLSQQVAASISVVTFSGVDTTGTNGSGAIGAIKAASAASGAPTATLVTTRANSLVYGVGTDWDNAIARTPGTNQSLVHQFLATVGDTYWVQKLNTPVAASGTSVTINDTAPVADRYNLFICEILPASSVSSTFTINGSITPAPTGQGPTVTLSANGTTVATTTVNTSGSYSFAGVANGTYTVTPSQTGFAFSPASQNVTVNGANATLPPFTATQTAFSVTGTISGASGATVTLSQNGTAVATAIENAGGSYTFNNVTNGTYRVAPTLAGFSFSPVSQPVTVNGANVTVAAFTAASTQTFSISGAATGSGATVSLTQNGSTVATVTTNSLGNFSFSNIANGAYTVTPTRGGVSFLPASQSVTVNGANVTGVNFSTLVLPDLSDVIPTNKMSIVSTGSGLQFQYTHDTLNGGPGPLVIQPVLNQASGNYQGFQQVYSLSPSGVFTLVNSIPVAGVFVFDSDHGHFHFPFVTYGLYTVGANGGPGSPVALSGKVSFCINDSFIFEPNIPNAGALGNLGSCADPTSLRGLDIGAVDEYDQTDAGQSISLTGVPDGTYWLRAVVDPDNFLAEADKTNNETDVELTISGTTLTVVKTVTPVLNPPPSVTLTNPANNATISGVVQLQANTAMASGVQFLVDGQAFGPRVTTGPFTQPWDTRTVQNGSHWIAAQTTDPSGINGTSAVALVTVSNSASSGPTPTLQSPANGSILSAIVSLDATVASSQTVASVTFLVDLSPVGTVTKAPYILSWDTTKVPDGQHTITVSATDSLGNTGTSVPVTLSVNNSHPANLIGKDVSISVDGSGVIATQPFSTTTVGDLLVAFVAYDGPLGSPQTATVSGAGLNWVLVERSNTQSGTAEIWSARADGTLSNVIVSAQPGTGNSFHGILTVIGFTNAAGTSVVGRTGAPGGAPDIPLPGVIAGDWVFAVGNDWDNAIARTPVSGQLLVHQKVDTAVGDTYWVQSTTTPSATNALVDIHDSAPTTDQWNYAAVEIVATHQ